MATEELIQISLVIFNDFQRVANWRVQAMLEDSVRVMNFKTKIKEGIWKVNDGES